MNLIYTILVTEVDGLVNRFEVREEVDRALVGNKIPEPEEVGTSPEAIKNQQAMMDLLGGK